MSPSRNCAATIAAGLLLALPLTAQKIPLVTLGKPVAEHPEPLTQPVSVRELRDGRVLITDMDERRLLLYDFAQGTATPAARQGSGPLEFQMPGQLFAIGDSTVMPDVMQRRFLYIGPNGAPMRTQPLLQANSDLLAVVRAGNIFAIDAAGRIYSESRAMVVKEGQMPTMSDTVALVRWSKFGVKGDTLATKVEKAPLPQMSGSAGTSVKLRLPITPYVARDLWHVFPNGRVVILRAADYHSEWIAPNGTRTVGPRVDYTPAAVTAADRERLRKNTREAYERAMKLGLSMAKSTTTQPLPKISFDVDEPAEWPKVKPPFVTVLVAPDERIWVATSTAGTDDVATYDILDLRGKVVKRVRFAPHVVVLGFGKGVVYATRKDDDDLRYLQRYPMP